MNDAELTKMSSPMAEIQAMSAAYEALRNLDPSSCHRALAWIKARLNNDHGADERSSW